MGPSRLSLLMEAYCVSVNDFQQHMSFITQFRTSTYFLKVPREIDGEHTIINGMLKA